MRSRALAALKANWRFGIVYLLIFGAAATVTTLIYLSPIPAAVNARHAQVCPGIHGVEKCVREQITAQGAPSGELTCAEARLPGHVSYLCDFQGDLGAGCYDIVASRGKNGYPLLEAVSQKSTC